MNRIRSFVTPPEWALGVTGIIVLFIMSIPDWNKVGAIGQQVVLGSAAVVVLVGSTVTRVLWRRRWSVGDES